MVVKIGAQLAVEVLKWMVQKVLSCSLMILLEDVMAHLLLLLADVI